MFLSHRHALVAVPFLALATVVASPARADTDDVIEVDASLRALPRVVVVPDDEGSVGDARELARLLSLTGLVDAFSIEPGGAAGGSVVRLAVSQAGEITARTTRDEKKEPHRRTVRGDKKTELPRLADAVVEDLTGTRAHLSGQLLVVDAKKPGERRVRLFAATGALLRDASPEGVLARGPSISPGGKIHFAMGQKGDPLRLFEEGAESPLTLRVPGFVQAVAFSTDPRRTAVIAGDDTGGDLFVGVLGAAMKRVETEGLAIHPVFGPEDKLAWAAGPAEGPLRVYVDGEAVTPKGVWATAPTFCDKGGRARVAYMVKHGAAFTTIVTDLATKVSHSPGQGTFPACSPDGRTLAVGRGKEGVFLTGEDGLAKHRVIAGEVTFVRWLPGPPLPVEG